jgi:hypothetical protein
MADVPAYAVAAGERHFQELGAQLERAHS